MKFLDANREVFEAIVTPYIWRAFAWEELRERYKRSIVGILWIPFSFLLFVGVKVLVFSQLNGAGFQMFSIYVVVGYWVWQAMNAIMVDSCSVFVRSAGLIKSSPLPYSVYILQGIFRNSVTFFYNFIIVLGLYWIVMGYMTWQFIFVVPAYFIYVLNGVWLGMFLGVWAARFRDILHFTQTIMRAIFFMTPIVWLPQQLGDLGDIISLYNPFTHFIEIVRMPVAGQGVPITSWIVVLTITAIGWVLGCITYSRARSDIVHWV